MMKNKMMRLASVLLVAVLLSTCAISGTFAKYTTNGSSTDSARIAKWGITVATTNASGNTAFQKTYSTKDDEIRTNIANSVEAEADVLAPGTEGTFATPVVSGTAEVAVTVSQTAILTLSNWKIGENEYCPIVFTVGDKTYGLSGTGATQVSDNVADLISDVQDAIAVSKNVGPGSTVTNFSTVIKWAWAFENSNGTTYYDDSKDTKLAEAATAPQISLVITITVTQID